MNDINTIQWAGKSIRSDEFAALSQKIDNYLLNNPDKRVPIGNEGPRALAMASYCQQNNIPWSLADNGLSIKYSVEQQYLSVLKESSFAQNIIAISDCFLENISMFDRNHQSIGSMLKIIFPNLAPHGMAGMNPSGFYYILLQYLLREQNNNAEKKILLLELTPIAFSPNRPFLPDSQHSSLFRNILTICPELGKRKDYQDYLQTIAMREKNIANRFPIRKVYNEHTIRRDVNIFVKMYYEYEWNDENESVRYLHKILSLVQKNSIDICAVLAPINHDLIQKYIGSTYLTNYQKNVDALRQLFTSYDMELFSIQDKLTMDDFADDIVISETLNQYGRKKYAETIIKLLEELI